MGRVKAWWMEQMDQTIDNYARGKLTYLEAIIILTEVLNVPIEEAGNYLDMEEI